MSRSNASTNPAASSALPRARRARPSRGLTLIELLITLAVLSIVAAMLIPQLGQQSPDQLMAAAEIVAADVEYARSLAVVNNSKYQITFDVPANRYRLRHSGANTLLHVLPPSAFRRNDDPPDQQTTDLADLPLADPAVELVRVIAGDGMLTSVSDVEFTPLGGTTRIAMTTIWLQCGQSDDARFIPIEINPATGLVEIGAMVDSLPAGVVALEGEAVAEPANEL
jgi:prepilin-type N-terminal cleavage/methylation domain-containing protein